MTTGIPEQMCERLAERYRQVLLDSDVHEILAGEHISGLFLPKPSDDYFKSDRRVFTVGREVKGWPYGGRSCPIKSTQTLHLADVRACMENSLSWQDRVATNPKKSKYWQARRLISTRLCADSPAPARAALWSNLYCLSYKKGHPGKSNNFWKIRDLSLRLVRAQLEVLEPHVVFFLTGPGQDRQLKRCFAAEQAPGYITREVVHDRKKDRPRLWWFQAGNIQCFRTNHPTFGAAWSYIQQAIDKASNLPVEGAMAQLS